jgi:biotin transport system substrate-specific component
LPVFAGGKAGIAALMGPTGGYLLGFVVAAYIIGYLSDRGWFAGYVKNIVAMTLGTAAIFACGLPWLALYVPGETVFAVGLVPFVPGAVVKIGAASLILPTIMKFVGRK